MKRFALLVPLLASTPGACSELDKLTGHYAPPPYEQFTSGPGGRGQVFAPLPTYDSGPIDRNTYNQALQLGGGMSESGAFNSPPSVQNFFADQQAENGVYRYSPAWRDSGAVDSDHAITFTVRDGYVTSTGFEFNPPQQ